MHTLNSQLAPPMEKHSTEDNSIKQKSFGISYVILSCSGASILICFAYTNFKRIHIPQHRDGMKVLLHSDLEIQAIE